MPPKYLRDFNRKHQLNISEEQSPLLPSVAHLEKEMGELFHLVNTNPRQSIPRLKKLIEAHPEVPSLYNHLYTAYVKTKQLRAAKKILKQTRELHPNYLFGILSDLGSDLDDAAVLRKGPLLGPNTAITDWPAREDGSYHLLEFITFELAAVHYLIVRNDLTAAHERMNRLMELGIDEKDENFMLLVSRYQLKTLENFSQQTTEGNETRVNPPHQPSLTIPLEQRDYISPFAEFNDLILTDSGLVTEQQLAAVSELPSAELTESLRQTLRGALAHYLDYRKHRKHDDGMDDDDDTFSLIGANCVALIGALEITELLPDVLNLVRMDDDCLEYFMGDFANLYYRPTLFALTRSNPAPLIAYLHEPGNVGFDRSEVVETLGQLAQHDQALRPRVIGAIGELWQLFLDHPKNHPLLDTDLLDGMIHVAIELRAAELVPQIRQLHERGWSRDFINGSLKDIEEDIKLPPDPANRRPLPGAPIEYFTAEFRKRQLPSNRPILSLPDTPLDRLLRKRILGGLLPGNELSLVDDFDEGDMDFSYPIDEAPKLTPVRTEPKVGRNDPCPCGSGRKYKHCCLRK